MLKRSKTPNAEKGRIGGEKKRHRLATGTQSYLRDDTEHSFYHQPNQCLIYLGR